MIGYANMALGKSIIETTGTFDGSQFLGTMQSPTPHMEVTPTAGEIEFSLAESGSIQLLALLGHTLPDDAVVTFSDGTSELVQITVTSGRPHHIIARLDQSVAVSDVTINITNAGSSTVRIAGLWASAAFVPAHGIGLDGYAVTPESFSRVVYATATPWVSEQSTVDRVSVSLPLLTAEERHVWREIARAQGTHAPYLVVPSIDLRESVYGLATGYDAIRPYANTAFRSGFQVQEI